MIGKDIVAKKVKETSKFFIVVIGYIFQCFRLNTNSRKVVSLFLNPEDIEKMSQNVSIRLDYKLVR